MSPKNPLDFNEQCDANKEDFYNTKESYLNILRKEEKVKHPTTIEIPTATTTRCNNRKKDNFDIFLSKNNN